MTVAMNSITNLIPKRSVSGQLTIGSSQQPAATSKGRSTSRHSTPGTYDNHVTHFLHDNVIVEFHYSRIDWGIAEPRIFLSGNMNGGHQRADDSRCTYDRVQINVHDVVSTRYRRFLDRIVSSLLRRMILSNRRCLFCLWLYDRFSNSY